MNNPSQIPETQAEHFARSPRDERRRIAHALRDILSDHYMTIGGRAHERLVALIEELDAGA